MEKSKVSQKQKILIILVMVSVALIATSWSAQPLFNFLGGNIAGNIDQTSPSPTNFISDQPRITPTYPIITSTPSTSDRGGELVYLLLDMSPNPAVQRDIITGYITSNLGAVTVTAHYIDTSNMEHTGTYNLNLSGSGSFTINLKTGSYPFWITYNAVTSNTVTLMVTP